MRRRMHRNVYPRRQVRTRHGLAWQVRLEPLEPGASLAPTVAPVVDVEPTVQALLAYLRERDQQRDQELAELRATLAQAHADLVDHAAQLAEAREQLRALQAPETPLAAPADGLSAETARESTEAPRRVPQWLRWVPACPELCRR